MTNTYKIEIGILYYAYHKPVSQLVKLCKIQISVLNKYLSEILYDKNMINKIITIKKGYKIMESQTKMNPFLHQKAIENVKKSIKMNFMLDGITLLELVEKKICPSCNKFIYGFSTPQQEKEYIEFGFCGQCTDFIKENETIKDKKNETIKDRQAIRGA